MCLIEAASLIEVTKKFSDEKVCLKHLKQLRWGDKPVCPHCNHETVYRFKDGKTFKCANKLCQKKFNAMTGTIYENSKVPLSKWFVAVYLITSHKKGISSCQLAKDVGVTQKTAWFMNHRIRQMLGEQLDSKKLSGIVEMDETYVGGKEKNKHSNKKTGGTQGRNTDSKIPVIGIVERGGDVHVQPVDNCTSETINKIIADKVNENSTINTDSFSGYNKIDGNKYTHNSVNHSQNEWVKGDDIHTNTIEGFWGLFKRGLIGIYHRISKKHFAKYGNEFSFRYNTRKLKEGERMNKALMRKVTRLKYKDLIKKSA